MKTHRPFNLLLVLLLLAPLAVCAQQVEFARVYLDDSSEPFSTIDLVDGDNINENITVDLSDVPRGVHRLFLEVVDAEENVTHKVRRNILIEGAVGMATLTQAEYYFDTDPGFGNGYAMLIPEGASVDEDIYISVPDDLERGVHRLFVRVMDGGGQWSHLVRKNVLVEGAMNMGELTGIEYFFDTDPGIGNGLAIISPGGSAMDVDLEFPVPTDLSLGAHLMYVRVQDGGGQWSHYVYTPVTICDMIVPEIATEGELCALSNFTISVPDVYQSYLWSNGGTENYTVPGSEGTYFVTVDDGDCSVTVYIDIEITELPVPVITVSDNTLTCSEAGYGYVWYLNGEIIDGANEQSYEATEDGLYSVMITLEGCYQYSEEVDFTYIGVDEPAMQSLLIFPNPAIDQISILPSLAGPYDLSIIDAAGRICLENRSCIGNQIIDISMFSAGTYQVIVKNGEVKETTKMKIN